jgi:hypothetical protein
VSNGAGWKDTRLGELAVELHKRMNVAGLELAIGKDEARGHSAPARLIFSVPDGEDLEAPAQQGGAGKHVCEDRVVETIATVWGATPGEAERLYERLVVALRELGVSRRARTFGRVKWEVGGGRPGSVGVKVSVPIGLRLPILSVDLKTALVLGTHVEAETVKPSGDNPEAF